MGASQSTSSTTTNPVNGGKYDVFISFRGEDTRDNITSHLYDALCRKNIHTFIDYRLKRGDEISPALLKAIEESRISVVIFSKDYASSKWCLRELAEIMKCQKMNKQIVVPVFYHVDPSAVRKQTGSFKDAFDKHKMESGEEVQIWRDALTEASNLAGWHSFVIRPESRLVDEIVKDVLNKLKDISPSSDSSTLVGSGSRIEKVKSLLCIGMLDFRVVGIWGMGGIGKTTIAGAVFEQISCQFEGRCFTANVREESDKCGGLLRLRDQIISKILEENVNLGTLNIPLYIKRRLQSKRVVVVLDDVNSLKQLEILAGGLDRFGLGSRIIMTSRDKQVLLNSGIANHNIYEVEALDNHEALQLFCKYAFKEDHLPKDLTLMAFAHRVVEYAEGNPLALKVLGSSLYRKSKQDWESALHKLNKISNTEIHNMLKISYDALDDEEKDIFLDIACFFKGESRDSLIQILNSCYFSAQAGLSVLIDKSLITISCNNIEMHDLLQEMGWEIVRQESVNKPGERSRLHNHKDACLVLKRNIGTEAVKGIFLDMSKMKNTDMSSDAFEKMCNVRFLKFYDSTSSFGVSKVQLPSGISHLPDRLSYFHWNGFPSKVLPSNLILENLVELYLFDSNVERLWEGKMHAPMLKWLILGNSTQLTRMPDLSGSPYLKVIDLIDCRSLLDISFSIQHLNNLNNLRLTGCENLGSFPSNIHFESHINLSLDLCINLTKFPQISGNIEMLNLSGTAIEEVPSSVECLTRLFSLDLSNCTRLKHISASICKLKSLHNLNLNHCNLMKIPEDIGCLSELRRLRLHGNYFESLPKSIKQLSKLTELWLNDCSKLQSLTDLPLGLEYLAAENCKQLQSLPDASYFAEIVINGGAYISIILTNCLKLNLNVLGNFSTELQLLISEHMAMEEKEDQDEDEYEHNISFFCPGSEIPEWFNYQGTGSFINIQLPEYNWCDHRKLVGVVFCAVISFEGRGSDEGYHTSTISYNCYFKTNYGDVVGHSDNLTISSQDKISIDSDHVFLWYTDSSRFKLLRDDYTTFLIDFWLPDIDSNNCDVKSCGVSLIYTEAKVAKPSFSVEKFGTANQDFCETRKCPDETDASGSGSGSGWCDDEEMDPPPKRFQELKSTLSNYKVVLFYRSMHDRAGLLSCYCWIFLLCLFCGLCVFGMLGLLVLHLSTQCEIYLSSHVQIMQGKLIKQSSNSNSIIMIIVLFFISSIKSVMISMV